MPHSWSEWHRFSELQKNPAGNCKTGVYQIRATTKDRQPIPIARTCEADPDGILYIGEGDLAYRVGNLLRICETSPKYKHDFIWVFYKFDLERKFDRRYLEIRWMECAKPAAITEERRLIYDYKKRTGDLPPGNRKMELPCVESTVNVEPIVIS